MDLFFLPLQRERRVNYLQMLKCDVANFVVHQEALLTGKEKNF